MTSRAHPAAASAGAGRTARVTSIVGARSALPPEVAARWFSHDDAPCVSDRDCAHDRLCLGGHCV